MASVVYFVAGFGPFCGDDWYPFTGENWYPLSYHLQISKNTAIKSIGVLLEMDLITVESSSYFDKHGMKWKGNNFYTILPIGMAVEEFHRRQLRQLELDTERRRVHRRQEEYDRRHPRTALCAPAPAQATSAPSQPISPLCAR